MSVERFRDAFRAQGYDYAVSLEMYWNAHVLEGLRQFSHEELRAY